MKKFNEVKKITYLLITACAVTWNPPLHSMKTEEIENPTISNLGTKKSPKDFKEEAEKKITTLPRTYATLESSFAGVLLEDTKNDFKSYFTIIFDKEFPLPVHKDHVILKGYQCLYTKMAFAHTLPNEEEKKNFQHEALFQLMAFHKTSISLFDKKLGEKIPEFTCKNCKKSALKEIEIVEEQDN